MQVHTDGQATLVTPLPPATLLWLHITYPLCTHAGYNVTHRIKTGNDDSFNSLCSSRCTGHCLWYVVSSMRGVHIFVHITTLLHSTTQTVFFENDSIPVFAVRRIASPHSSALALPNLDNVLALNFEEM